MIRNLYVALIFALGANEGAAQTGTDQSTQEGEAAGQELPAAATWSETIRQVFFTDDTSMMLLPEADIRAKWSGLSSEDQRIVRRDCEATRSGAVGGAAPQDGQDATGEAPAEDAGEPSPPMASEATGAAGSAVAAGDISLSHLVQICGLVDQM